ncbi:bola protein [Phialemonium atrogriseum]|uniref:Bola protein n=1 Tax=Phialemonium atrogriseum TaxID=1093897 RepID=A0AAJ0C1L3_9PEZI|nr:bola protein [Phialemonium atrogriseum]KAK1767017.1 bola protein [Phialemonium atrogriseum]
MHVDQASRLADQKQSAQFGIISIEALSRKPLPMQRRALLGLLTVRQPFSTMASQSPLQDAIREKITAALQPSRLEIHNDSHLHAHHAPMAGNTSSETHFRVVITSEAFKSKMQAARHRMIYSLLKDEMAREGGIHALQLRTMTPEEEERRKALETAG